MKRSLQLFSTIGLLTFAPHLLSAADEKVELFIYDPTRSLRPNQSPLNTLLIPRGPAAESRFVRVYSAMVFPNYSTDEKPEIKVNFNGEKVEVGPAPENTAYEEDGTVKNDPTPPWYIVGNTPIQRAELRWDKRGSSLMARIVTHIKASNLQYTLDGIEENTVAVTAELPSGEVITKEVEVFGVEFPPEDRLRIVGEFLPTSRFNYAIEYRVPPGDPLDVTKTFGPLGKFGFSAGLRGKMNFYPFQHIYTSETVGGAHLYTGENSYTLEVGSTETSKWVQPEVDGVKQKGKWEKTESKIYLGLNKNIVFWEKSLFDILPGTGKSTIEKVPILGGQLKRSLEEFKLDLTGYPTLYGEVYLGLKPKDPFITKLTFGGEMDVRLAVHAVLQISGLGKFGAEGMIGGKANLDAAYPVNSVLMFDNFSAEIFLGASVYFFCFEASTKYTLAQIHFPDVPQGALPPLDPSDMKLQPSEMTMVPPPKTGEQIEYPLAPVLRSAPRAMPTSLAASKAMFRQLGVDRVLTRRKLMPMGLGSEPVIEASATVPLAVNTTSVAWPSIASNVQNGEMLALFGVDTRKPGSANTGAQFTEIRWTAFKNGEWSAPQPLPPGNGAAQIAPTVVRLSDTKPGFIAAWQQLEDPAYAGTDLPGWLNQTQVAVGVLGAEAGQTTAGKEWKTKMLGTPGRADLSPRVVGHLGEKREDGLAMWVSTSLEGIGKSPEENLPVDAEFRYALYHAGEWTTPDYANEEIRKKQALKAPRGLVSWDVSGDQQSTYLVYAENTGEKKSRLMAYVLLVATDNPQLNEWRGPIQISDVEGSNLNPQILMDRSHNPTVLWTENGSLVAKRFGAGFRGGAKKVLRPASEGATPLAAKITLLHSSSTGHDSDIAVSWTEPDEDGHPSIMTTIFEYQTDSWSKPMAITPGEAMESLYATTTDQFGNLVPLYVHTEIAYGTVTAPNDRGVEVDVPNAPIPGQEKLMVGRFRPTRDLGFAPDALTSDANDFIGGTLVKLTARVKAEGMLGYKNQSVSVAFYHGDPKKGGKLIKKVTSDRALPGGGTIDISTNWALSEDFWDRSNVPEEVFAVIQPPVGSTEWNSDNNTAVLNLVDSVPSATVEADSASQDGSAEVAVTVKNSGVPYMNPFRVAVFDYSGTREIASEILPKVPGGGVGTVKIDLPEKSVQGDNGADFLIKIDPGNTLKLDKHLIVPDLKVHIRSAPH